MLSKKNFFYLTLIPLWNFFVFSFLDEISIIFIVLTAFLIPLCFLSSWVSIKYRFKDFAILLFALESFIIISFSTLDIFIFFFFFEFILFPMFLLIGIWGSRSRKIHATFLFFFYTLFASLLFLLGILYIYLSVGSSHLFLVKGFSFSFYEQLLLWFSFFFSFSFKVPMIPFHLWLPEAHVEASAAGSILLAGTLLKLGGYGFFRFLLFLFPEICIFLGPVVQTIGIISVFYASFTALRQVDLKKIIAYSSIIHMNFAIVGLFSFNQSGIFGFLYLILMHGFSSSALFFIAGLLYDRYNTRLFYYYGGLGAIMPLFSIFYFFFTIFNISFPGTGNFLGEFFIIKGVFCDNFFLGIFLCISTIINLAYNFWLFNRVIFGKTSIFINKFSDLNLREFYVCLLLIVILFFCGIFCDFLVHWLSFPVKLFLINLVL